MKRARFSQIRCLLRQLSRAECAAERFCRFALDVERHAAAFRADAILRLADMPRLICPAAR